MSTLGKTWKAVFGAVERKQMSPQDGAALCIAELAKHLRVPMERANEALHHLPTDTQRIIHAAMQPSSHGHHHPDATHFPSLIPPSQGRLACPSDFSKARKLTAHPPVQQQLVQLLLTCTDSGRE